MTSDIKILTMSRKGIYTLIIISVCLAVSTSVFASEYYIAEARWSGYDQNMKDHCIVTMNKVFEESNQKVTQDNLDTLCQYMTGMKESNMK